MKHIRQWVTEDGITFDSKEAAQEHEATVALQKVLDFASVNDLVDSADEVIALLKPFATRKPRTPKGNGATKAKKAPKDTTATGEPLSA